MATAAINVSGIVTGAATGNQTIGPISITSSAANPQVQEIVLTTGANTITPPLFPATSGVIISLNSANTSIVTLKGIAGDTGIALGKTTTTVLNWDPTAAPASFVLNIVLGTAGQTTEFRYF